VIPSINLSTTQDIDSIHGLEAACSLAADGGGTVKGGNWQIFEQFVERSGAQIFLKTEVEKFFCFSHRY
jgi:prenylcysteine oxidase/farnesylcysteine lyase